MGKVVLGGREGAALASTGQSTTEVFESKKPPVRQAAPPLEMRAGDGAAPPVVDGPGERPEAAQSEKPAPAASAEPDEHVDPEDRDLSDITIKEVQDKARRKIGKYAQRWQTELKRAEALREEAAENERFAKQLFDEREEYRRRMAELEARIPKDAPKEPELKAPDENDPKYKGATGEFLWRQFSDDNAAYQAKKAIADDRKAQAEAQARAQAEAEAAALQQRIAAAEKKYPDWKQVVTGSALWLPNEALEFIKHSDYGADIAYFLAKHPEEAEKIKAVHPTRAVAKVRDIEAGFEKPPQTPAEKSAPPAPSGSVERAGAPAPITPIVSSGAAPVQLDPAKMTFQQLRQYERERAKAKRR